MKTHVSLETNEDLDHFCALERKVKPILAVFGVALVFTMFPGYAMLHIMAPREQQPHYLWPLYNIGGWLVFCFVVFAVLITILRQIQPLKGFTSVPRFTRDAIANFEWAEKAYSLWKAKGSKHQLKKSHTCIQRIEKFYAPLYEIPKVKALRESILKDMEKIG
jgi:hypothetical protein